MFKIIGKLLLLTSFLWMGNALADDDASPLADLHKGTLFVPCIYVVLEEGDEPLGPINVKFNQNGSSANWKVASAEYAIDCPEFVPTEDDLSVEPDGDSSSEAEECVPKNAKANNCHTKNDDDDDDDEVEEEEEEEEEE